jgi:hypothetical protein
MFLPAITLQIRPAQSCCGGASMRLVTVTVALAVIMSITSRIEAGPHGGGHAPSPPKPPHFSPPPVPHFSQPTPAHTNVPHSNAVNQGGFSPGYMPRYTQPRSSTANRTKTNTNTKLHNLANALQKTHPFTANSTGPQSAKDQTSGINAADESHSVATNTNARSNQSSAQGKAAIGTSAYTSTSGMPLRLSPAYLSLMSELYGPYGLPHYGVVSYGRRYYGSRLYGNRNYGNQNNSMYFAQMRRLARLSNDLNMLNKGSAVSANMISRIRGDLMGVVFGNGMPPYQTVHELSLDLVTHLPSRATPMFNSGQLARDLMVAMNGSGHNMSQIQSAIGSAHSLLNMSGVNRQGIQKIVTDMTMVASWGDGGNALTQLR